MHQRRQKCRSGLRLVGINYDDPNSKLNKCVQNVFDIWENTKKGKLTQVVFSDLGTPKKDAGKAKKSDGNEESDGTEFAVKFDIYNDIKSKLIKMGVPAKEIAFIHSANSDESKRQNYLIRCGVEVGPSWVYKRRWAQGRIFKTNLLPCIT